MKQTPNLLSRQLHMQHHAYLSRSDVVQPTAWEHFCVYCAHSFANHLITHKICGHGTQDSAKFARISAKRIFHMAWCAMAKTTITDA